MTVAPRGRLMLAVNEVGAPELSYWPSVGDNREPVLEDGETLHKTWRGLMQFWTADGKLPLRKVWASPKSANFWLTDRRIVYVLEKYDIGSTAYMDIPGVTGGALALGSRTIAKMKRHGKVAAGQIRFDWPASVLRYERRGVLGNVLDRYLAVDCASEDAVLRTLLHFSKGDGELEKTVIQAIAGYRFRTRQIAGYADSRATRANRPRPGRL